MEALAWDCIRAGDLSSAHTILNSSPKARKASQQRKRTGLSETDTTKPVPPSTSPTSSFEVPSDRLQAACAALMIMHDAAEGQSDTEREPVDAEIVAMAVLDDRFPSSTIFGTTQSECSDGAAAKLRTAYRRFALVLHPDKHSRDHMQVYQAAFQRLKDRYEALASSKADDVVLFDGTTSADAANPENNNEETDKASTKAKNKMDDLMASLKSTVSSIALDLDLSRGAHSESLGRRGSHSSTASGATQRSSDSTKSDAVISHVVTETFSCTLTPNTKAQLPHLSPASTPRKVSGHESMGSSSNSAKPARHNTLPPLDSRRESGASGTSHSSECPTPDDEHRAFLNIGSVRVVGSSDGLLGNNKSQQSEPLFTNVSGAELAEQFLKQHLKSQTATTQPRKPGLPKPVTSPRGATLRQRRFSPRKREQ